MSGRREKVFVFVHGSYHGAWAFARVASPLVRAGHQVVARDLPGHGLQARFPRAYLESPQDPGRLATEPSPLSGLSLEDCTAPVIADIERIAERAPGREIVLVGHSFAGIVLNAVGEAAAGHVHRLVYLSAFMLASGTTAGACIAGPDFASSKLLPLAIGDPAQIGAFRINPGSGDPAYRAALREVFAADVDQHEWEAAANLLTPDTPARPHMEPVTTTADRWGAIPRTYVSSTADEALPLALQRRFIREADAFTPHNPTDVRDLATSHSAYWSRPEQLTKILLEP